jgi:hypothetical protein
MSIFWSKLVQTLLPDGVKLDFSVSDDLTVICFDEMISPKNQKHWWQEVSGYVPIAPTAYVRDKNNWTKWQFDGQKVVTESVVLQHTSKAKRAVQLVRGVSPSLVDDANRNNDATRPIFTNHLRGHQPLGPQDMAMKWQQRHGGELVAFDYRPDFLGPKDENKQGFTVVPSWDFFHNQLVPRISLLLKCFYETIMDGFVGFFLDLDGVYKEFPMLKERPVLSVILLVFECINKTWQDTYHTPCPITRDNVYVFDQSNEAKLSLHFVASTRLSTIFWKSAADFKEFLGAFRRYVFRELLGRDVDANDKRHVLVDMTNCDRNHKFRMLGQTKMRQNRHKSLSEHNRVAFDNADFADALVGKPVLPAGATVPVLTGRAVPLAVAPKRARAQRLVIPDAARLASYPVLCAALAPYRTASSHAPHNYRWLHIGEHYNLPPDMIDKLPRILASEKCRPLFLDEAFGLMVKKLVLDFDQVPGDLSIDAIVCGVCAKLNALFPRLTTIQYCLVRCLPRPEHLDKQFFHVIVQVKTSTYKAIVKALDCCWIDDISSMRTVQSDKLDSSTGEFASRTNQYGGTYEWKANVVTRLAEPDTEETIFARCSVFANLDGLPLIQQLGEEAGSPEKVLEEYDPGTEAHEWVVEQWVAKLPPQELDDSFQVTLVQKVEVAGVTKLRVRTNHRICSFELPNFKHKSQTQKGDFYLDDWVQSCWNCHGKSRRWNYTRPPPAGIFPPPSQDALLLCAIVSALYPNDQPLSLCPWVTPGKLFFGTPGQRDVHYQWRDPFSLVRRDKATNMLDVRRVDRREWEQWHLFQQDWAQCDDPNAARTLLEMVDKWIKQNSPPGVIPVGILHLSDDLQVCYYSSIDIKARPAVTVSLRMGTCQKKSALPPPLRQACFDFVVNHLTCPPGPKPDPQERIQAWIDCGIPAANIFRLTDPANVEMRLPNNFPPLKDGMRIILDATMGSGKTQLVKKAIPDLRGQFLYVCALRSLSTNAAREFGITSHLDEKKVVRPNLGSFERLSVVINSLWQLKSADNVFWDEFRQDLLSMLSSNVIKSGHLLEVWDIMCQMISNGKGVHFFADANIGPELEGWFLASLIQDKSNMFVIIKDTERNPWNTVKCYEMLGTESEAWYSIGSLLSSKRKEERFFFPVNEELFVHVAEQLFSETKPSAFVCGSSEKNETYTKLTESTKAWETLGLLCASGVISSGLSCIKKVFSTCINLVANRSDNTWDNEQKWVRQRPVYDSFFFYFRNRGSAGQQQFLSEQDLENLASWTLEELQKYVDEPHLNKEMGPERNLFWKFAVRATAIMRDDHMHYRRNVIRRLNKRGASLVFRAPPVEPSKEAQKEIKRVLLDKRKAKRNIARVLGAPMLSTQEKTYLEGKRKSNGTLLIAEQAALDKAQLHKEYNIPQTEEYREAFEHQVMEHYAKKLPARLKCLRETILKPIENPLNFDFNQYDQQEPLHLRYNKTLAHQMTLYILETVLEIDPEWIRAVMTDELASYKLYKNGGARGMYDRLCDIMQSPKYKALHKQRPVEFPLFGTSNVPEKKLINYWKAFLCKARGIPVERDEGRRRENGKKHTAPFYRIDYQALLPRVSGFSAPPSSKQTFVVHSLSLCNGIMTINGGEARVSFACAADNGQFVLCQHVPEGEGCRWAWFLQGRVVYFPAKFGRDLAALRAWLVGLGYMLLDRPISFVTCSGEARVQVDWITNQVTDVSEYNHHLVLERRTPFYTIEKEMGLAPRFVFVGEKDEDDGGLRRMSIE